MMTDAGVIGTLTRASPAAKHVYRVLAEHQQTEEWALRELLQELQRWATVFNGEFKLDVTEYSLCVDRLRRNRLGHFRPGHNGFGLRGEVAINRLYLDQREFWQVLGTLLHEMLHAWQQEHGRPGKGNYHNKEFRDKAQAYGLVIDRRGYTQYEPDSPFMELLRRHGVTVPEIHAPVLRETGSRAPGSSKLKKWSCGCTNVRVAVADFRAQCLHCGSVFVLLD
ncbi:MAG: SprT-like domain-containing protein [Gemmataceae bacterium]|nr:SprT-like domain-containing protein [Gemmataceae bacterium]